MQVNVMELRHKEHAHERAVAAINDAITAASASTLGHANPAVAADLSLLIALRDRMAARHEKLAALRSAAEAA